MDRNTVIGLVLIGVIFAGFTIFNQPSEEEIKAAKAKQEQLDAKRKKEEAAEKAKDEKSENIELASNLVPKLDENGEQLKDSLGGLFYTDTVTQQDTLIAKVEEKVAAPVKADVKGEIIQLETNKLIVHFDTKGGKIAAVRLKEFETFEEYDKKDGKVTPLYLFKEGDADQGLTFPMGEKQVNTANEIFSIKNQTEDRIAFELNKGDGKKIEFIYQLKDDAYDLDFDIRVKGFQGAVNPKNVMFNWDVAFRKTERLFSEQRRVSTVCFNYDNEGFSYLSEMGADQEEAEDKIDWLCYKQSYFSSFLNPDKSFDATGSTFEVKTYSEGSAKDSTHLKDYTSTVNLGLTDVENGSTRMNWYFGPNDYKVLRSYKAGYDDVLNYGWGVFRWINLYAVQPIFKFLASTGMGMGIVILLLTLIIKTALMPIQWKMYTSSAKMRILRPEIEEINARYPDKEDAMKKQMETMSLYRESGASPLAGCVPMLIQMPILLAVFRFFPATFDLRQKSFLWAQDLSSYDSIWDFGTNIWLYGDHVSLFTLLMAATTLIYTFINSGQMQTPQQPGMPNMKYIMYFFPIMMIFFFNNYSSGLSYYYFISTLTSIVIMLLIKKFFVNEEKLKEKMAQRKAARATAATGTGGKTKSKFQERLEKMQQAQQEQMKNRKK